MAINSKRFIKEPVDEVFELYKKEYNDSNEGVSVQVTFKSNGSMVILEVSWGDSVEEHYGDFDIEVFRDFDKENTAKLKQTLGKQQNIEFCNLLRREFFQKPSFTALDLFCDKNEINYTSVIY